MPANNSRSELLMDRYGDIHTFWQIHLINRNASFLPSFPILQVTSEWPLHVPLIILAL